MQVLTLKFIHVIYINAFFKDVYSEHTMNVTWETATFSPSTE